MKVFNYEKYALFDLMKDFSVLLTRNYEKRNMMKLQFR